MGIFGKSRKDQSDELMIQAQEIYLLRMNEVMEPVIQQDKKVSLPAFWHAHQQSTFLASKPFNGVGSPQWAHVDVHELRQAFWDFAWNKWSEYVITDGYETWSYPNGRKGRWDGSRVVEG